MQQPLLYLCKDEVERALPPPRQLVDALEYAFGLHGAGKVLTGPKGALVTGRGDYFGTLAALSADLGYGYCQNTLAVPPAHAEAGTHHIRGLAILTDAARLQPLAIIDAFWPATWLPAAATAVAARRLARPDAKVLGFIATGEQAKVHLAALEGGFEFRRVLAWNRSVEGGRRFADWAGGRGIEVELTHEPRAVVKAADLLVSSVPHAADLAPFLDPAWVPPGAFVSSVDLGRSWKPGLEGFERVVSDDIAQAESQYRLGRLRFAGPYDADLGQLLTDARAGREDARQRVAFVHPGHAVGVLAIAAAVYERALAEGIGTRLPT